MRAVMTLQPFLTWWAQQMLGWLPPNWRSAGRPENAMVAVVPMPLDADPPVVELVRTGRRGQPVGLFTLDTKGEAALRDAASPYRRLPVVLRLPPAVLLERRVVLPLLAEREPRRVLEYEMDRFTPFRAEELFWAWGLERRDRARGQVHLLLTFVPKALLSRVLEAMDRAGVAPVRLEAPGPAGEIRKIALFQTRSNADRWRRRGLAAIGGTGAMLLAAVILLPFLFQQAALDETERKIVELQPRVAQIERLRREVAARLAGTDVFAAEQARVGDTLEVLAALTDILPDDTFVTELTLRQGKLNVSGQSAAAARLISALSADRVIRNPAFAAPVTRTENGRADQFSIRAEIAP